jgi:hypothetical protein
MSTDLMPVILWLENGCDPKPAAHELRLMKPEIDRLTAELAQMKSDLATLEQESRQMRARNERLEAELAAAKEAHAFLAGELVRGNYCTRCGELQHAGPCDLVTLAIKINKRNNYGANYVTAYSAAKRETSVLGELMKSRLNECAAQEAAAGLEQQLLDVRAELAAVKVQAVPADVMRVIESAAAEALAVFKKSCNYAAMASDHADSERLEWLIANEVQVWEINRRYSVRDVTEAHAVTADHLTARDAIDAARAKAGA